MKKLKKTLSITCCLMLLFSNIAFANQNNEQQKTTLSSDEPVIAEGKVSGYEFTYKDAPLEVRENYEKKCNELNIIPKDDDTIFIPQELVNTYSLKNDKTYMNARADYTIYYRSSYFEVTGKKNYVVYVVTTVGYNYTTSGNAVHLVQLLTGKNGYPVGTDGIFGTDTYNAIKSCQRKFGLTSDGIVGQGTWKEFGTRLN